jgi:hypothetical protein
MTDSDAADVVSSSADSWAQGDSSPARVTAPDTVLERLEALNERANDIISRERIDAVVCDAGWNPDRITPQKGEEIAGDLRLADDAALIAAARNALPDLLAVAKAAKWFAHDSNRTVANDPAWQRLDAALAPLLREVE